MSTLQEADRGTLIKLLREAEEVLTTWRARKKTRNEAIELLIYRIHVALGEG